MTRRNRTLLLQFLLAAAVCVAIGFFDRPLIGLVGFGVCVIIFGLRAMSPSERRSVPHDAAAMGTLDTGQRDASIDATGERVRGCYNPDNPMLPVYYPIDRRG